MSATACTTCAHVHAPLPDGWAALDFFDRRAMAGQLSHRLDCTALPDADKPCLKPAAQAPAKAPGLAQAVTVQQPMRLGSRGLFTVQAGVPLNVALDELSLLLSAARDALHELGIVMDGGEPPVRLESGLVWPIAYMLDVANALQSSILCSVESASSQASQPGEAA